jgi:hypothetical protein
VLAPTLVQIGALWSSKSVLYFSVTDNTAVRHISVYVNGSLLEEYSYFDDVSFRWWHAMYPADGVLTLARVRHFSKPIRTVTVVKVPLCKS